MEYISTKEASALWKINTNRITVLAKSGRIPGAVLVGKSWLIPADAKKPADGRTKSQRAKKKKPPYRFPVYYWGNCTEKEAKAKYSNEENDILLGGKYHEETEYKKSSQILEKVYAQTDNKYIKIACLFINCDNYIFSGDYERAEREMLNFKMLLSEEDEYKDELDIIKTISFSYIDGSELNTNGIDVSHYRYKTPECRRYLAAITPYCSGLRAITENQKEAFLSLEILIDSFEEHGYLFYSMMMHAYMTILFLHYNHTNDASYHFKKAITLSQELNAFTSISFTLMAFRFFAASELESFPKEVREKYLTLSADLQQKYKGFLSYCGKNSLLASLDDRDIKYLTYVLGRFAIKDIANHEHLSLKSVNRNLSILYEKFGVNGKNELVEKYSNIVVDFDNEPK